MQVYITDSGAFNAITTAVAMLVMATGAGERRGRTGANSGGSTRDGIRCGWTAVRFGRGPGFCRRGPGTRGDRGGQADLTAFARSHRKYFLYQ